MATSPTPRVLFFDVETTDLIVDGVIPDIVSIAWCVDHGPIHHFLLATQTPSAPKALAAHRLTRERLARDGKKPESVMKAFMRAVHEKADVIVSHNLGFDARVVVGWLKKHGWVNALAILRGKSTACTMLSARNFWHFPHGRLPKLTALAKQAGISVDESKLHSANYDVQLLRDSFFVMVGVGPMNKSAQ